MRCVLNGGLVRGRVGSGHQSLGARGFLGQIRGSLKSVPETPSWATVSRTDSRVPELRAGNRCRATVSRTDSRVPEIGPGNPSWATVSLTDSTAPEIPTGKPLLGKGFPARSDPPPQC